MITESEILKLKPGDKLIFFKHGGVLNTRPGYVFTFANFYKSKIKSIFDSDKIIDRYWQCQELLDMGNKEHSFDLKSVELFNKKIHKEHTMVTSEIIEKNIAEFESQWNHKTAW